MDTQKTQKRLQKEANRHGGVFPRSGLTVSLRRNRPLQIGTEAESIELTVMRFRFQAKSRIVSLNPAFL
jgi:hypothetical protein